MDETEAADRISSLPDDLLHLVLLRLGCARAAARTSVLSRQWRRVCSRLPVVDVTLNDVPLDSLEAALRRAAGQGVRLLDIRVPEEGSRLCADSVSSVLCAAAALAPVELRFTLTRWARGLPSIRLPSFHRATTIQMHGGSLDVEVAHSGYPLLERLTLSGCYLDLAALIPCCPHLRVLTMDDFTVHSASLQDVLVERRKPLQGRLNARLLKQLTTQSLHDEFGSTILAPMVEKVSLRCTYPSWFTHALGLWHLDLLEVGLESPERHGAGVPTQVEVLSVHMSPKDSKFSLLDAERRFATEIFSHMGTHFSALNLHITTRGHMVGAFVLRLLGIHYHGLRLADIRNLKIVLLRSEVKEACPLNCPCNDPKGWKTQIVSLNNLEKVEIEGFEGEDHELDLLRVVFRCAPMLKSVTVRLLDQDMPSDDWCTKVNIIFREYPYVEGNIDLISGMALEFSMEKSESDNGPSHGSCGSADLISTLSDDLLLQVLQRLSCARAAVRTSILSHRWHGFWTHLPKVTVILHDVPFGSLEAALQRAVRPGVFHRLLLDISVPWQDNIPLSFPWQEGMLTSSSVSSLLRAAARLAPVELLFTLMQNLQDHCLDVDLPRLDCATSIDLHAGYLRFAPPRASAGFPSLKRLSLSGCHVDLAALIPRCPCLRFLTVNTTGLVGMDKLTMHSQSLQELVVEGRNTWTARIDVEAPMLKQLIAHFHAGGHLGVSVLAPMVEKVSWHCSYKRAFYRLGIWGLLEVSLNTAERHSQMDSGKNTSSQHPIVHVMSLHMCAQDSFNSRNAELRFESEIYKHMFTDFSCLDLHLRTKGHGFGALVLRLLGMDRIRTTIRNLKIILLRSEVKDACPINCLCDEPKDWRTQTISLADLESVEIEGLDGEDHEFDFLKVLFNCALMLKRVTLRLADGATPCVDWCSKVHNILLAYPFVECNIDLVSRLDAIS
ncbi:hypothetical protein ACQJBY_056424 [Aegilops geniculata]